MNRLVLFDIDETMISSDGAGRRALARALKERHDIPDETTRVPMSGKTDPQILLEIFTAHGFEREKALGHIDDLIELYLGYLDDEMRASQSLILHRGVVEILEMLAAHENSYLGLLTGNVEIGARKKLDFFALNPYFPVGAYGSDSADRLELPAYAVQRAQEHFQVDFAPPHVVIVGDSVNDIACAHGYGAKVIAVNTGKTSWQDLAHHNPEHLFKNLADTEAVFKAVFS